MRPSRLLAFGLALAMFAAPLAPALAATCTAPATNGWRETIRVVNKVMGLVLSFLRLLDELRKPDDNCMLPELAGSPWPRIILEGGVT